MDRRDAKIIRSTLIERPRVPSREVATKEELDRVMYVEVARHLRAIADAIVRRYTESTESKGGPGH